MFFLDLLYAKLVFKLDTEKRLSLYRKISSLLKNNFTLMEALRRIELIESKGGVKNSEPFAICARTWQKNLENGDSFAEATKGWVSYTETLILSSGDISSLSISLDNISKIIEAVKRIKRAVFSAISYPLFLFALTFGIIIMSGIYLIPPLIDAVGSTEKLVGNAYLLLEVSNFVKNYWDFLIIGTLLFVFIVFMSLSNWSGFLRIIFDKIPPYNLYKVYIGVSWMVSLSAMLSSGCSLSLALRLLSENSNKYLNKILQSVIQNVANGDNLGKALENSKTHFPNDEIIGDLAVYSDMNNFNENISKIAEDYLENSVRKAESISSTINTLGIILVSFIIAWVVLGTFQIQDQIMATLS